MSGGELLDHLVGAGLERSGDLDTKNSGGLQVDDQLQFVGLLDHRHLGRIKPF